MIRIVTSKRWRTEIEPAIEMRSKVFMADRWLAEYSFLDPLWDYLLQRPAGEARGGYKEMREEVQRRFQAFLKDYQKQILEMEDENKKNS